MIERNKGSIALSGIDPGMKRLSRLHAIRSAQEKKAVQAVEAVLKAKKSIDHYWDEVAEAIEARLEVV